MTKFNPEFEGYNSEFNAGFERQDAHLDEPTVVTDFSHFARQERAALEMRGFLGDIEIRSEGA